MRRYDNSSPRDLEDRRLDTRATKAVYLPPMSALYQAGVGDLDRLITSDRVGVLINDFTPAAYDEALFELDSLGQDSFLSRQCQTTAQERFDLESVGGLRYRRLYSRVLEETASETTRPTNSVGIDDIIA